MAPSIKITYFNAQALAEPFRMLLKYGGLDFEDIRFEDEDWPKFKPATPFGQVPIYEEDGKVANQSLAITRYVAKKVNLVGSNDWEDLEIDAIVDTIIDLRLKVAQYHYEEDPALKESRRGTLFNETIPFYLERLDKIAEQNKGHLAVGKLTWADVLFTALLHYFNYMVDGDFIEKQPNLQAVRDNVLAIPNIKAWVETRPKTSH